jgi:acetolactate synthase small subunit
MEQITKQLEKMFDVNAVVDQIEKNAASALTFLPHAELKETLLTLNKANANFARANLVAMKSFGEVAKTLADEAQKNIKTAVNSK